MHLWMGLVGMPPSQHLRELLIHFSAKQMRDLPPHLAAFCAQPLLFDAARQSYPQIDHLLLLLMRIGLLVRAEPPRTEAETEAEGADAEQQTPPDLSKVRPSLTRAK